jgi:hypothetical protein
MSQTPLGYNTINPAGALRPNQADATGNLLVGAGSVTQLNVTTKSVIKVGPGRVVKVTWVVATAAACGIYDAATTAAGVQATALWAAASTTAGQIVPLDAPVTNGIVVDPGASGVVSVIFD